MSPADFLLRLAAINSAPDPSTLRRAREAAMEAAADDRAAREAFDRAVYVRIDELRDAAIRALEA